MGWFSKTEEKPENAAATASAAANTNTAGTVPATTSAPAEEAEEYAVMPKALRVAIAAVKGRAAVSDSEVVKVPMAEVFPISAAVIKEDRRKEAARRQAEEEALKNPTPGRDIANEGIYLGQYSPKDRDGKSLGKTFNVFAAKEDLTDTSGKKETFKYVDAVKRIASLKGWNGHNGTNYATDKEFYAALKKGSYDGGWIIPTRDILSGNDVDGKATTPDNLYAHKDKGALKGTFCTAASSGSDFPDWYWSSTEDRDDSSCVRGVRFSDGSEDWDHKDNLRLSCRPVRLVAVSAGL